jgi:hypothetical protein
MRIIASCAASSASCEVPTIRRHTAWTRSKWSRSSRSSATLSPAWADATSSASSAGIAVRP